VDAFRPASSLLIAGLALLASACGGGDGAAEVRVWLREWTVDPSRDEAAAGKVKLVAENQGTRPHELVVIKSDLPPDGLPLVDGKVNEDKVNISGEIEPFAAGATVEATFELSPGKYLLICNIVELVPGAPLQSHYQNGMLAAFLVIEE